MKCRLIEEKEIHEPLAPPELIRQCERRGKSLIAPVGTIIEGDDCWLIVMLAQAEPADDECRDKCNLTPERWAAMLHARQRLARGIRPEDFARYDAGELLGYDANGNDILGPNAAPAQSQSEEW